MYCTVLGRYGVEVDGRDEVSRTPLTSLTSDVIPRREAKFRATFSSNVSLRTAPGENFEPLFRQMSPHLASRFSPRRTIDTVGKLLQNTTQIEPRKCMRGKLSQNAKSMEDGNTEIHELFPLYAFRR